MKVTFFYTSEHDFFCISVISDICPNISFRDLNKKQAPCWELAHFGGL